MIFLPHCHLEKYILGQELPGVEAGNGVTVKVHERNFCDYRFVFYHCCRDDFMGVYSCQNLHIIYLKWMYFITLKLYLNKIDFNSIVENVRNNQKSLARCREGPLKAASQKIIMAHFFSAILCSLEFEIGQLKVAER